MVACETKPDGQSYLVPDNVILESDSQLNDFTILQIPGEINKQLEQKLIVAIVNFVFDGKIFGEPYIAVLYKDLSYDQLSFELAEKGAFLLPKPYYNMNLNFKLLLKDSAGSVYCSLKNFDGKGYCSQTLHGFTHYYDPATLKPFLNIYLDKILNEKENNKKVIQIIVDWDLSLKEDFEKNSVKEEIKDDDSLQNKFIESKQTPVSLISMLDKFVKPEPIQFWTCPKCKKPSGSMQIKFDRLPDILVFYIKRFDHSGENTKNNTEIVHSPEELDMSSYFINKLSKNSDENKYDLSCVIFHNGSEFSS
uniref:ubiquitinyl hydrolase 1 n=1 Tax=Meloidogyne javanica TaxID=6303 RepID=A0A915M203_MELJA